MSRILFVVFGLFADMRVTQQAVRSWQVLQKMPGGMHQPDIRFHQDNCNSKKYAW
jgi:hypothetical protein